MRRRVGISNLKSLSHLPDWLVVSPAVGLQIREIRLALGMNQDQLARRVHMNQSFIAEIESGKRNDLCVSTVKKLAKGLHCQAVLRIVPEEQISKILDKKSDDLAQKIVSATSGSAAIEKQAPDQAMMHEKFLEIKKDILERRRSSLWETS